MKPMNPTVLLALGLVLAVVGILFTLLGSNKTVGIACMGVGVCAAGVAAQQRNGAPPA